MDVRVKWFFQAETANKNRHTLIEKDHLGNWSPEKDCCWRLTFRQPACAEAIFRVLTLKKIASEQVVEMLFTQKFFSGLQSPE